MEKIGRFFGVGPKGYKRSDDRIREDVCEALTNDYDIDASNIEVEVKDGIVTLSGEVNSRFIKRQAEDCVENISGVKDVTNKLRVDILTSSQLNSSPPTATKGSRATH